MTTQVDPEAMYRYALQHQSPDYPHFQPGLPTSSNRYEQTPSTENSPSSDFSQSNFIQSLQPDNPPQSSYRFPEETPPENAHMSASRTNSKHQTVAHPYARLYAKKDSSKRHRKIWNHALEKSLFNSHEL